MAKRGRPRQGIDGSRVADYPRLVSYMPPDLFRSLKEQAKAEDRAVSRIVEDAIRLYLEHPQPTVAENRCTILENDLVMWTAKQSRHIGRVWAVLYAGERPEARYDLSEFRVMFALDYIFTRDHESFLVEVLAGPRAKHRLYWPLVNRLSQIARGNAHVSLSHLSDRDKVSKELARWQEQSAELD